MDIKEYWNQRSSEIGTATTDDIHLRNLERETLVRELRRLGCNASSTVVDLGCGDGRTVLEIAAAFSCYAAGYDFAEGMIRAAGEHAANLGLKNIKFALGDVRKAGEFLAHASVDFAMTDRCLINLESSEEQYSAIEAISSILKPGGVYLCIENFLQGNDRMNELRAIFGLPPIPVRWHNKFFDQTEFEEKMRGIFSSVDKIEFSSAYYLATRVIYSKLCAVENLKIDYAHPIHELSTQLPVVGDFSPIKLYVLTR